MPDLNDFHAFKNTGFGSSGSGGSGCLRPSLIIAGILILLILLGKCSS